MKEEELYGPVKEFFENCGYKVNGEVRNCDVTAVKDDELIIVELKKSLNVELLIQGVKRQKFCNDVYIAVPQIKKFKSRKEFGGIVYLLRRLELGLIFVDMEKRKAKVMVEPKFFDIDQSRKKNKRHVDLLKNEIGKRTLDLNTGGCTGKKLVTAYKEQAIMIACLLKRYGAQSPGELRDKGADYRKAPGILKRNFYKWFEPLGKGKYKLTEKGIRELEDFRELKNIFFKKISEKNKILYISDLDGTLLDSNASISPNTENILNKLIDSGVCFTVATARAPEKIAQILKNVKINIPVIALSGAIIYDPVKNDYLKVNGLSGAKALEIIKVLEASGNNFFMYTINEDKEAVSYYRKPINEMETEFLQERLKSNRKFIQTDSYKKFSKDNVIYFTLLDSYEALWEIKGKLSEIKNISIVLYKNSYRDGWLLEVFSIKASKKTGMEFVCQYLDSRYTIAFGDNFNDFEFMAAANESYAVSNAQEEILRIATGIIGSNDEDGPAIFIERNENL